jgi:RNA polymerase sigma-70 factor (ECF subfamily)
MTSIVRNRCLDWLRRPNLEIPEDDDNRLDDRVNDAAGPLELLQSRTEAQELANCLGRLDAKMRQAIMLAFFDGMSHSELAGHMREPLGTVKTWVRRGLERLKTCLGT